jgi:two-component system response regulator PhoP
MRVLLVEDDVTLRETVAEHLVDAGWTVDQAGTAAEGVYAGTEFAVDLAIVDLGLPDGSGIDLIRTLRAQGTEVPILILTARDHWRDKVEGLNAGADDYLVKPFHPEELKARIQALVRRASGWADPRMTCGPVCLDSEAQAVTVSGDPVTLTSFEYQLLETLMRDAGKVFSKANLTDRLYHQDFERDSNVIEVLIARLRRKLDPNGDLRPIETLRGRGYRFAYPPDREESIIRQGTE